MTTVGGGQFTIPADAATQAAAAQIAASTTPPGEAAGIAPTIRQATVVSNDGPVDGSVPPTCTVTFDGTTNVPGIRYAWPEVPAADDVVYCVVVGGTTWIAHTLDNGLIGRLARGGIGSSTLGTQPGISWHDSAVTPAAGDTEISSDYRITVPACPKRMIELKWTGMLHWTAAGTSVLKIWVYSGGLSSQLAQVNYTGAGNAVYTGFIVRRRLAGPSSSTTYTVSGAGTWAEILSAIGYSAQFTIDDVGGITA